MKNVSRLMRNTASVYYSRQIGLEKQNEVSPQLADHRRGRTRLQHRPRRTSQASVRNILESTKGGQLRSCWLDNHRPERPHGMQSISEGVARAIRQALLQDSGPNGIFKMRKESFIGTAAAARSLWWTSFS